MCTIFLVGGDAMTRCLKARYRIIKVTVAEINALLIH